MRLLKILSLVERPRFVRMYVSLFNKVVKRFRAMFVIMAMVAVFSEIMIFQRSSDLAVQIENML